MKMFDECLSSSTCPVIYNMRKHTKKKQQHGSEKGGFSMIFPENNGSLPDWFISCTQPSSVESSVEGLNFFVPEKIKTPIFEKQEDQQKSPKPVANMSILHRKNFMKTQANLYLIGMMYRETSETEKPIPLAETVGSLQGLKVEDIFS